MRLQLTNEIIKEKRIIEEYKNDLLEDSTINTFNNFDII